MNFKKLLSFVAVSVIITSSSFKLNNYRARATKQQVSEIVKQHISTRQKILDETGVTIPKNVPKEHVRTMYNEAKKQNVPLKILVKVIERESKFDSKALNPNTGAKGYMQLMPTTYRIYSKKLNLEKNPINNIKIGTFYLKEMYEIWNRAEFSERKKWKLALASYNAGINKVIRIERVPDIIETKNFVNFILE